MLGAFLSAHKCHLLTKIFTFIPPRCTHPQQLSVPSALLTCGSRQGILALIRSAPQLSSFKTEATSLQGLRLPRAYQAAMSPPWVFVTALHTLALLAWTRVSTLSFKVFVGMRVERLQGGSHCSTSCVLVHHRSTQLSIAWLSSLKANCAVTLSPQMVSQGYTHEGVEPVANLPALLIKYVMLALSLPKLIGRCTLVDGIHLKMGSTLTIGRLPVLVSCVVSGHLDPGSPPKDVRPCPSLL